MGVPSTNAIVGPQLLENDPDVLENLAVWDKNFFRYAMGIPRWMAGRAYDSRDKIIKTFMKWGLDDERMLSSFKIRGEQMALRGVDQWDYAVGNYGFWTA